MSMIQKCDTEIKSNSKRYLNGGRGIYKTIHIKYICGAVGIFLVLILFVTAIGFEGIRKANASKIVTSTATENKDTTILDIDENKDAISSDTSKEVSKEDDIKLKYENFLKIKIGESYDNVTTLLGQGEQKSSSQLEGIQTIVYRWKEAGVSEINVTVQNNVVVEKSQLGLESSDAQITMEKYNQVENGISYEEMKELLGEGQILTQSKIDGVEISIYEYMNQNGSSASFTFSYGKLVAKLPINLE